MVASKTRFAGSKCSDIIKDVMEAVELYVDEKDTKILKEWERRLILFSQKKYYKFPHIEMEVSTGKKSE